MLVAMAVEPAGGAEAARAVAVCDRCAGEGPQRGWPR